MRKITVIHYGDPEKAHIRKEVDGNVTHTQLFIGSEIITTWKEQIMSLKRAISEYERDNS